MEYNQFVTNLRSRMFNILVEFTPRNPKELSQIAAIARELVNLNESIRDKGVQFSAIMLTQNPGGRLSYEIVQAVKILRDNDFPTQIEIIPHITCKDLNLDALEVQIKALMDLGILTALALTGDKPSTAQPVFQIDSLGLLMLINRLNASLARQARTLEILKKTPQLAAGAAISPFKYSEPSLVMQYYKAEKKVASGAQFLITQAGWDVRKNRELIEKKKDLGVPVIGNALLLDYNAAYVMKDLPGCVVTPEFMSRLESEKKEDGITRAAQQIAMFKALGYEGVDLGNVATIDDIKQIVMQALEIQNWEQFESNISFPPKESVPCNLTNMPLLMGSLHKIAFEEDGALFGIAKKILSPAEKSYQHNGLIYRGFFGIEQFVKGSLFECRLCGDCYLPENYFVCTIGGCAKGLPNPPCGDPTVEGLCGNDTKHPCVAELIYFRARKKGKLDELHGRILEPRDVTLEGTSSILNHYYGRTHVIKKTLEERSGLKQIAELLHASIPSVGPAMQYLKELGEQGFKTHNRALNVICDLIITQASYRPAFIDINIDQLGGNTPELIRYFVRLIRRYGMGVPVCVDSSNPEVLRAGIEEWYAGGGNVKPPLVNSINYAEMEKTRPILELRKKYDFKIVGLLIGSAGVLKSPDEMYQAARTIFQVARKYGFKNQQIFFDTVTLGITFDSPINEMGEYKTSHTYNSFHAIQRIMNDPDMKGVNTVLGVSNWTHDVKKRRIGHNRAFIAVAQKYGLNSVIIDVMQDYGIKPAPPELMDLVEMFASLDGSEDSVLVYNAKIREMRQKGWV